jgi:lysophospholipase L1-like esterase
MRNSLAFVALAWSALACSESSPDPQAPVGGAGGSSAGTSSAGSASAGGGLGGAAGSLAASGAGAGGGGTGGSVAGGGTGGGGTSGGGTGGVGGSGGAPVELADFQLYGRWDVSKPGKAVTVNSGSHVTASFHGSGVSAKFDITSNTGNRPTVSFKIDGGDWVEKEIGATLELAANLSVADHTVALFVRGMNENEARWTPPLVASTTFLGFDVEGGNLVKTPRPERTKIEFLGDSITEGVALHSQGPQGQTTPNWRTDGPRGYAALTALALNAEWRQVGFGRQGLTIVGNGGVPKAQDAFNWFYAGVPRDDWQPDLVVINQGTNDRGAGGETFAPLYLSFLGLVRTAYPLAKIAALRPFVGDYGTEISAQVAARKAAGDTNVFYVDTAGWTAPGDFTDGVHPNVSGSVKISEKLVTALSQLPP